MPHFNGKRGPIRPQVPRPDRPLTRTQLRVLDDMHGRNDMRHFGYLHGPSPPSMGRPQRLPLGVTAHGREILSEVYFLRDAEIPSEGALCSAATDYQQRV